MDLINRYVYAVTKSLPEKQREDIEKELRTLIEDMIEQNQGMDTYDSKVEKVLIDLGDPEKLSDSYRGSKRYLIGPNYYEKYILILKIVFGAVFIGITIAIFLDSIFTQNQNFINILSNYIATIFSALLQAFAWTTIAFTIAERNSMNRTKDISHKNEWRPSQLPIIPMKKAQIPLSEPILGIVFTTIFIVLLYSAPQLFSAYISNSNGTAIIPVFNLEVIHGYRLILVCLFIISIFREGLKLYSRRWTLKLSVLNSILSILATVLVLSIFMNNSIWNMNFSSELIKHTNWTFDIATLWETIKSGIIVVIILGTVIDILTILYKGVKYNIAK
jgi:hypothetical protein